MGELRFDGQVVVITGAGGGLGRAHALAFADRGATVVVNDVSPKRADAVVAEITAAGGRAVADHHPVGTTVDAAALVTAALGVDGRIDVLVNNAGTGGPAGPFAGIGDEALEQMVTSHLLGTFRVSRAAWPHLVAVGGRVLTTASMSFVGADAMAAYSMVKGGIVSLTRSLALEGAAVGVRANCLLPVGYTYGASLTPDPEVRRWMQSAFPPERCSPAALWLSHPDCTVTGESVVSAGGRVALVWTTSVPGLQLGPDLTPEAVRDRWAEVVGRDGAVVLHSTADDVALFTGEQARP